MKYLICSFLIISVLFPAFSQGHTTFGEEGEETIDAYFAFKLVPGQGGDLIQCAIITKSNSEAPDVVKYVTMDEWVKQFTGYSKSAANPKSENLALKHKVFYVPDTIKYMGDIELEKFIHARTKSILNNMWRLRYREYPYKSDYDWKGGWARNSEPTVNFLPSKAQWKILESYGIVNGFNDFVKAEQVIRLMTDMLDKNFQNTYMQSTDSDYVEPEKPSISGDDGTGPK